MTHSHIRQQIAMVQRAIGKVSITVLPEMNPDPNSNPNPRPSNHPPILTDINATTNQDTSVTIPITVSDPDQGDTATITNTSAPTHGKISVGSTQNSFVYTPNAGFSGSDSFTVQATDSHGAISNIVTVSITVLVQTKLHHLHLQTKHLQLGTQAYQLGKIRL